MPLLLLPTLLLLAVVAAGLLRNDSARRMLALGWRLQRRRLRCSLCSLQPRLLLRRAGHACQLQGRHALLLLLPILRWVLLLLLLLLLERCSWCGCVRHSSCRCAAADASGLRAVEQLRQLQCRRVLRRGRLHLRVRWLLLLRWRHVRTIEAQLKGCLQPALQRFQRLHRDLLLRRLLRHLLLRCQLYRLLLLLLHRSQLRQQAAVCGKAAQKSHRLQQRHRRRQLRQRQRQLRVRHGHLRVRRR